MPAPPKSLPTGEEVLFLTSRDRLFNAFYKWYSRAYPGSPENSTNAAEMSRALMRYLSVPSQEELERYRRNQLPDGL